MTNSQAEHERWFAIVVLLSKEPGVVHGDPGSKTFGHSALKVNDRIFAMISSAGRFVVKLPRARVDVLEATAVGVRFATSRGHPMKEWLQVDSDSGTEWLQLAREALNFVRTVP